MRSPVARCISHLYGREADLRTKLSKRLLTILTWWLLQSRLNFSMSTHAASSPLPTRPAKWPMRLFVCCATPPPARLNSPDYPTIFVRILRGQSERMSYLLLSMRPLAAGNKYHAQGIKGAIGRILVRPLRGLGKRPFGPSNNARRTANCYRVRRDWSSHDRRRSDCRSRAHISHNDGARS